MDLNYNEDKKREIFNKVFLTESLRCSAKVEPPLLFRISEIIKLKVGKTFVAQEAHK